MKIVEFGSDLTINSTNIETYCTASDAAKLNTSTALGATAYDLYLRGNDGTVKMNDRYKQEIYPTNTAKPCQIKAEFGSRTYTKGSQKLYLGGNQIWEAEILNQTNYNTVKSEALTGDIISNATRASELRWDTHSNSVAGILAIIDFKLIFSFYQYEHKANIAKFTDNINALGVKSVKVSNPEPYHGDSVTYSVELHNNSEFIGWYRDSAHTQFVSDQEKYTIDNVNSDMILYAYAVQKQQVSYKQDGQWKEGIAIWLRQNNEWKLISKNEIPTNVGYEIRESQQNE